MTYGVLELKLVAGSEYPIHTNADPHICEELYHFKNYLVNANIEEHGKLDRQKP